MDRETRLDKLLLALSAMGFVLFVYLVAADKSLLLYMRRYSQGTVGKALAELEQASNEVRVRGQDLPVWKRGSSSEKLFRNDQIFVDQESQAQLKFIDGSRISLGENSLVQISGDEKGVQLDLARGVLTGAVKAGSAGLEISMGLDKKIKLDANTGAELQIKKDDKGNADIVVTSGKVEISSGGKKVEVRENQAARLDDKGSVPEVKPLAFVLESPATGLRMRRASQAKVDFSWRSQVDARNVQVEIAESESFRESTRRIRVSGTKLSLEDLPKPGRYVWRVAATNPATGKTEYSETRSFTLLEEERAAQLLSPFRGETLAYLETLPEESKAGEVANAADAQLRWKADAEKDEYVLQVASDNAFKKLHLEQNVKNKEFLAKALPRGSYFWRVGLAPSTERKNVLWSEVSQFTVSEQPLPREPSSLKAGNGREIRFKTETPPVRLQWDGGADAQSYEVEVSRDNSFAQKLWSQESKERSIDYKPDGEGVFYWRVRPIDSRGRKTRYSSTGQFTLTRDVASAPEAPPAPELDSDYEIEVEWKGDGAGAWLWNLLVPSARAESSGRASTRSRLQWKRVPKAKHYVVEVARDADFADVVQRQEVTENSYDWKGLKPGRYYFRVAVVNEAGVQGPFSRVANVSVRASAKLQLAKSEPKAPEKTDVAAAEKAQETPPEQMSFWERWGAPSPRNHVMVQVGGSAKPVTYGAEASYERDFFRFLSVSPFVRYFKSKVPLTGSTTEIPFISYALGLDVRGHMRWGDEPESDWRASASAGYVLKSVVRPSLSLTSTNDYASHGLKLAAEGSRGILQKVRIGMRLEYVMPLSMARLTTTSHLDLLGMAWVRWYFMPEYFALAAYQFTYLSYNYTDTSVNVTGSFSSTIHQGKLGLGLDF